MNTPVYKFLFLLLFFCCSLTSFSAKNKVIVGAERVSEYRKQLSGKSIGFVGNQTSKVRGKHTLDYLIENGFTINKIFSPEHGFRGQVDAGAKVENGVDQKTGLPIFSLYGHDKKPHKVQLKNLDVMVFDLQDVGTRFYTYISTLHYVMEACAQNDIPVVVFDRPNPNGHFIDGPVREKGFKSFVGMHPVPVVHGMTIGEYAQMINGENWLKGKSSCQLTVIPCENYDHETMYELPVKPSPNLPNMASVYLYPSLCFFEGTPVSVGRGTDTPFQVIGHPKLKNYNFSFTPEPKPGAKEPKLQGKECFGFDLSEFGEHFISRYRGIYLYWLLEIYEDYPDKDSFFTDYFDLLAGTDKLRKQIEEGKREIAIKKSWQPGLTEFRKVRKKYLLYPDFTESR